MSFDCSLNSARSCCPYCFVVGGSGGDVNSLDFWPASLKSLICFYFRCVLSSQCNSEFANFTLPSLKTFLEARSIGCPKTLLFFSNSWSSGQPKNDAKTPFFHPPSPSPVIFVIATVVAFVLLRNFRFNFHCYTQREATPTQKSARKWRYDLSRRLALKITKGIHSCKPASLNRPIAFGLALDVVLYLLFFTLHKSPQTRELISARMTSDMNAATKTRIACLQQLAPGVQVNAKYRAHNYALGVSSLHCIRLNPFYVSSCCLFVCLLFLCNSATMASKQLQLASTRTNHFSLWEEKKEEQKKVCVCVGGGGGTHMKHEWLLAF